MRRELPSARAPLAFRHDRPDDFGDDVTRLADDHRVADTHVLAGDLILVVQRRQPDGGTADEDRVQLRERSGTTGAPDAHHDPAEHGRLLLGRELEGNGPPRRAAREAELVALGEVVDLHHCTVDLVPEGMPVGLDPLTEVVDGVDRHQLLDVLVDREPEFTQPPERLVVRAQRGSTVLYPELVGVEREVARRGDARILLAQAPGRRVARVGEETFAGIALTPVELLERGQRHEHLAPHLEPRRYRATVQSRGNRRDRGDVGGHVFAGLAVAPGRGTNQAPLLVQQRHREAVELGFTDEAHRVGDHPLDAGVPGEQLGAVERVVERQHRHDVPHRREGGRRRRAHLGQRRVCGRELGVLLGQRRELAHQHVEFRVGDLGVVVAVVTLAVVPDLGGELGCTGGEIGRSRTGSAGHRPQSTEPV